MKRGTVYASIGAVLGLLLILVSFLVLSIENQRFSSLGTKFQSIGKERITGAVVFEAEDSRQDAPQIPAGTARMVTNGKILYVAQESALGSPGYCSYGTTNEACMCPGGFEKRVVENYYTCVKKF